MNELLSVIELTGAIPGIFFSLIFLNRKNGGLSSKFLGLGLFFYSIILLSIYLGRIDVFAYSPKLHVFSNVSISISWPFFYLYVGCITNEIPSVGKKHLIHTLPFFLYLLLFIIPMFFRADSTLFFAASGVFSFLISAAYTSRIIVFLQRFIRKSNNYFTEDDAVKVLWLKTSVMLWLIVIVIQTLFIPFKGFADNLPYVGDIHAVIINLTSVVWIYIFAYFAITHPDLFESSKKVVDALSDDDPEEKDKYQIPEGYEDFIEKRLKDTIENERPYLNDQLTLPDLADSINVPPYLLSRYINKMFKKNFVTYINDLRIDTVKEKLMDTRTKDISILEIAFQSGFRTKSAFNNYFRKSQGMTPSEFRKKAKSSSRS